MTTNATTPAPRTALVIPAAELRAGDEVIGTNGQPAYLVLARGEQVARSYCGQPYSEVPIIEEYGFRLLIPGDQLIQITR